MMKLQNFLILLIAVVFVGCSGGGLPTLTSTLDIPGPIPKKSPYTSNVNYYGYADPAVKADGMVKKGATEKPAYYLYFWVPAVIDEVGIRMISPVGTLSEPTESDFVAANYTKEKAMNEAEWFDTYLYLEKISDSTDPAKIKDLGSNEANFLDRDDDGEDTFEETRHSKYNSLIRYESKVGNPLKALTRGVYRISFSSFRSTIKGSFVATVGTNVPGVSIAPTLEKLHALVNAAE